MEGREIIERLNRLELKVDTLIALLRPVHAHADWVGSLRRGLARMRLISDPGPPALPFAASTLPGAAEAPSSPPVSPDSKSC